MDQKPLNISVYQQVGGRISRKDLPNSRICKRWIQTVFLKAALPYNLQNYLFTIRFVDRIESANLNFRYRNKKGATNVLSFVYEQFKGVDLPCMGDIVICVPIARAEAKQNRLSFIAYCAKLVTHGILHILGYEHDTIRNAEKMEALEDTVLKTLKL